MMERALKERIIGAIILVVIAVSVVPVFLDGPLKEGEVTSVRVLLPGENGQESKTVVLNRERSEPIPLANESQTDPRPVVNKEKKLPERESSIVIVAASAANEASSSPEIKVQPEKSPPSAVVAIPSATSTTGMWVVQLGSFSSKENAENLAASLRKQGYAAFLSQLKTSSGELQRVRIGPQKDRESAKAMAVRLLKVGHKGQVLPHP